MRTSPNKTPSLLVITACLATGCAAHAPPTSTPALRDKPITIDLNRIVLVFAEENPYPGGGGAILSGTTLSHVGARVLSDNWNGAPLDADSLRRKIGRDPRQGKNWIILLWTPDFDIADFEYSVGLLSKVYAELHMDEPLYVVVRRY
jgi:hypothetical protein